MATAARKKTCDCSVSDKVNQLIETGTFHALSSVPGMVSKMETIEETLKRQTELSEKMVKMIEHHDAMLSGVGETPGIDKKVKEHETFFQRMKPVFWIACGVISFFGIAGIWNIVKIVFKLS